MNEEIDQEKSYVIDTESRNIPAEDAYQKVKNMKAVLKERTLYLTVDSEQDISLELGLLKDKVEFFEEVFGIRLVFRRKRKV